MEIEEWLSRGLSQMQADVRDLQDLLRMTERFSTQPSLSGWEANPTAMVALDELARFSSSLRGAWLSYVSQIAIWIGPDGLRDEPAEKLWERWKPC